MDEKILDKQKLVDIFNKEFNYDKEFNFGSGRYYYTTINARDNGHPLYFVTAQSMAVCSLYGCPEVIIEVAPNNKYEKIYEDMGNLVGVVMQEEHNGFHDIALGMSLGYSVFQFDGKKYNIVETSFPSPVTPDP